MSTFEKSELSAAIALMLESLRPGSIQARVLEAMVNKADNGLPRMTYDLEKANEKFAKVMDSFAVPSIWALIGLDVAPFPGMWDKMEFAKDNEKAIRSAVYSLKDKFESLGDYQDEDGNPIGVPISLFVFNKHGTNNRDTNVVTPIRDYCNAAEICQGKEGKGVRDRVVKIASRARVAGKDESLLVKELKAVFEGAAKDANVPLKITRK